MNAKNISEQTKEKYNLSEDGGWMKLEEGDNKVRIVELNYADYGSHYLPSKKKSYACIGKEKGCPLCEKGDKPSVRYITWVIDRMDGQFKRMEFGYSIAKQLETFANNDDYGIDESGFPYDITINRKGSGLDTEYTVLPSRKDSPLTEEEKEKIDELDNLHELVEERKQDTIEEFDVDVVDVEDIDEEDIPVIEEDDDDINMADIPY